MSAGSEQVDQWRASREPDWFKDIGYALQEVLGHHRYQVAAPNDKGSKPDDPGWHTCSCGTWEGYWCDFHPHVADHLRAVVTRNSPTRTAPREDHPMTATSPRSHHAR